MLGNLFQRILRASSTALSMVGILMVGVAIDSPNPVRAGSEHPVQNAYSPFRETRASSEVVRTAGNDGEREDSEAGASSSQIDDGTLSTGRVVSVNAADNSITIEHRPIARFYMEPMTMIFRVKDRTLLAGLTAGDKIRFKVERDGGGFIVTRLEHSN